MFFCWFVSIWFRTSEQLIENFPEAKLRSLIAKISSPRWVVPVLPDQELECLLNYAIELTKAGKCNKIGWKFQKIDFLRPQKIYRVPISYRCLSCLFVCVFVSFRCWRRMWAVHAILSRWFDGFIYENFDRWSSQFMEIQYTLLYIEFMCKIYAIMCIAFKTW